MSVMLQRLQRTTGVQMSARAVSELRAISAELRANSELRQNTLANFEFVEPDVERINSTTKRTNIVEHVSGVVLAMQATG
jgi:hypothetical protein